MKTAKLVASDISTKPLESSENKGIAAKLLSCSLLLWACTGSYSIAQKKPALNGYWVGVQDSLSAMMIHDSIVVFYSLNEPNARDTLHFVVDGSNCLPSYRPINPKNPLFIHWSEGPCSEIEYSTENDLMLIQVNTNRLSTWHRRADAPE